MQHFEIKTLSIEGSIKIHRVDNILQSKIIFVFKATSSIIVFLAINYPLFTAIQYSSLKVVQTELNFVK